MRRRSTVSSARSRSSRRACAAPLRVDLHAAHLREIDHHAVVADGVPGDVVAATADRNRQVMLACERDGRDDIVCAAAADDLGGAPVDHAVPDGASVVVGLVAGGEDVSPDRAPRLLENRLVRA